MNNRKLGLGAIMMIALVSTLTGIGVTPIPLQQQSAYAATSSSFRGGGDTTFSRAEAAPIATSGDTVYVTWWSNKTGDWEVFFKASADSGKTFGPKLDLSNSKGIVSNDASIAASGNNVYVSWWERANQTSNEPVMRVSTDNGKTFGEIIKLSSNTTSGLDGR
jgi:hypothetical protein